MPLEKLESSSPDELAELVCSYRTELGWSQQDLAKRAGCSRPTIARLEAGRIILSVTMNKVIKALNEGIAEKDAEKKESSADPEKSTHGAVHHEQHGEYLDKDTAEPVREEETEGKETGEEQASATSLTTLNGFGPVFSDPERVVEPGRVVGPVEKA